MKYQSNLKILLMTSLFFTNTYSNNILFENRYLSASKNYFSKNIASFDSIDEAKKLVKKNKIENNTILVISNNNKIMTMNGIYKSAQEASDSINKLAKHIKINNTVSKPKVVLFNEEINQVKTIKIATQKPS